MKLSSNREKFQQLFSIARDVASQKDVRPILQNVKIVADGDHIVLLATDGELSIRQETNDSVVVMEPGQAVLPTRYMSEILSESQDTTLVFKSSDDSLFVQGEANQFELRTQGSSDFPEVVPFDKVAYHKIDAGVLSDLIRRTLFSIDLGNSRYALGGVLLELTEGRVGAIATDGRRLAWQEGKAESVGGHEAAESTILPAKTLRLLQKVLDKKSGEVFVAVTENQISFKCGMTTIHSRLVDGRFPKWRNIIPTKEGKQCVTLVARPIQVGTRQAEIVTTDKEPGVTYRFSSGKLEMGGMGLEVGKSDVQIPIVYEGEEISLKIDPRFIIEFLKVLPDDKIINMYFAENATILFETDDGYSYVVMPLA
ncbi:MAG: DNA polymerase III subunit beta [Planctomycetia bacterium]|nr:DNA polymerase III subunit beta [Planctomycetia bacterium]